MPIDLLPNEISTPTRDQVVASYKRDAALRNPNLSSTDALVDADARTFADGVMPLYARAITISNNVRRSRATGTALTRWSVMLGGGGRLAPTGAQGFVEAGPATASGGATIFAGDEITPVGTASMRFKCLLTDTYFAGEPVPIAGISTGPQTDLPAGTAMRWSVPRPGADPSANVLAQSDGAGLSGGHNEESDDELQDRLDFLEANPPASGNESEYISQIQRTPGVPVGAGFVYPDIVGPGSVGVIFTLRSSTPGGNRIPNPAQIALVLAWLTGRFPASDAIYVGTLIGQPINVGLLVSWATTAATWTDATPWPAYAISMAQVSVVTSPTAFRLANCSPAPPVGATIGFYDAAAGVFRRKRILTAAFVSGTSYDVVCDTTSGASDTSFAPSVGHVCSPWSDSLNSIVPAVQSYFDALGPGEQAASFWDPGLRQRRSPQSPQSWPSIINNRITQQVETLDTIQDSSLATPAVNTAPTVGSVGASAYLFKINSLGVFPQ